MCCLPAKAPLNQRLSKWEAKNSTQGVYRKIQKQESAHHDYSTDDGDILSTLSNMGIVKFRVAERILRLHRSELLAAGYPPAQAAQVVRASSKWKADYLAEMSASEVAILTDPANLGKLFYVAAMTDLSRTNQVTYLRLGSMSLKVAFELGIGDAAIEFAKLELRTRGVAEMGDPDALSKPVDLPPNILDYIRRTAIARENWRSMSLYLDHSLRKPQSSTAAKALYQLAVDLSTMTRPSFNTIDQVIPSERLELPWFLLQRAADQYYAHLPSDSDDAAEVQRTYAEALNTGRDGWNDSRAAELLLRNTEEVKPGSPRWVELLTQAAMQGDPDFCFRLGDHRLKEEGWHPESRKWRKPSDKTSLWWIELSAYGMRHFPIRARQRYLLLAVLLRENGFREDATSYLVRGQAALRESHSPDAEVSIQWLQDTIDDWDNPEWKMTSTILLNAEPLYKQQRQETAQHKAHQGLR
ncbi:hypothetical protein LTR84_002385 [Exophiala bonariae]|uniref:Uncharacterized protein n=1 Tax=Exophiala bonariae TaxID=1690606 RepID=A0AAV9ND41_9EURO|nr:hypothetical protein LTR84_002385 [Exophiala bonariae]